MSDNNISKVIIIGSGLVGSLCACFMARRGYEVHVYEKRDDLRTMEELRGRSINLSLSHRGRKALKTIGLEDAVLKTAIPMKGRLLHRSTGELESVLYDPTFNQCIYSVGRNFLNRKLLEATEKYPNIELHFNHKLVRSNFNEGSVTFLNMKTSQEIYKKADLIIGADGAYSKLRLAMQQLPMYQFSQEYIEHGYLELCIPEKSGEKMIPNHLHIWPKRELMLIALPNRDMSWTVTLFMPFARFESLKTEETILSFFKEMFPDAVHSLGEKEIVETFLTTKPSPLVSIRCSPYHTASKFLIIGDAAHAMVPFFGQGMNAGFEDCSVLDQILTKNKNNIEKSIKEFTEVRVKDGLAISELAMYNYIEMRDLVDRTSYRIRKVLDNFLFKFFPTMWIPLYSAVSFSHMNYEQCKLDRKWQDNMIKSIYMAAGVVILLITIFIMNRL